MCQFHCLLPRRCIPALWEIAMQDHRTSDLGRILESTYLIAHPYCITGDAPDFPSPEEPGRLQSMGWQRVRQDLALSTIIFRTVVGRTKHQWLLVCGLWFNIFLSHLAFCSTGAHAPGSALLTTVSGFNKWKNKNRKWTHPPSRTPGSERIHWHGDGTLSLLASFSIAHWKWPHVPLSPTPG